MRQLARLLLILVCGAVSIGPRCGPPVCPEVDFFWDGDGDGFGDPLVAPVTACVAPEGYVEDASDCDDGDPLVNPGAPPSCLHAALPACGFSVPGAFSAAEIDPPGRNSGDFQPADAAQLADLDRSLLAALGGDAATAVLDAAAGGYELCAGSGAEAGLVLWRPNVAGTGQALWALRTSPHAAPLIVETPHPFYDLDTLAEGRLFFETLEARVLLSSGTHRCGSFVSSPCSGTTSVCGSSAPYRISDMTHVDEALFQVAHEVLAEHFAADWVVSVHGMGGDGVSLSNGTTQPVAPDDPVALFAAALADTFPDESITTCNAYPGATVDARLCGTTNTQGRHLNGSPDACSVAASTASERFLHLEQSRDVRDARALVADALGSILGP